MQLWRKIERIASPFLSGAVAVSAAMGGYLALLTGSAVVGARRGRHPVGHSRTQFVVLVPAHDEEQLIADTVTGLVEVNYPTHGRRLFVIADHCSDSTTERAEFAGAVVLEHGDPRSRGKGAALRWGLEQLEASGKLDDSHVVVIVDADTRVSSSFLSVLDGHFEGGAHAVQAHYGVRSPEASAAVSLRAAALAARHYVRPLGRTTLGWSSGLYGNGMAFRMGTLRSVSVSDHLTEDLEMACELVAQGVSIEFAADALVKAEMPETLDASVTQHQRWERGRIDVARRYVPRLARSAVERENHKRRLVRLDAIVDLLIPPLSIVVAFSVLVAAASLPFAARNRSGCTRFVIAASAIVAETVHVFAALRLVGAPRSVYRSLIGAPRLIVWKAVIWAKMLTGMEDASWIRTERNARRG